MVQNRGMIFKSPPDGFPVAGKDVAVEARDFDIEAPPPPGGITTKNIYASFDPYQRGLMRPPGTKSYFPPATIGEPMANTTIARVLKSDTDKFAPGDLIIGRLGIEEFSTVTGETASAAPTSGGFRKLTNPHNLDPVVYLGALGMPGLTAYSSLYDIGKPKKGETIFISSAAGAVGQIVGQLSKHEGLKVIGSVGSDEKLDFILKDLGFDSGFNYKKEKAADALARLAPNGIDIYYENVGGEQLEAAINALNSHGRIVACGMISQYSLKPEEAYPIRNIMMFVGKRLNMRGFIVSDPDMGPKYLEDQQKNLGAWIADGSFKVNTDITEGIENSVDGFLGMLQGKNFGKAVLKIARDEKV